MVKIFITIAGIIIITFTLLNRSPRGMLGGLETMTALVLLVFTNWHGVKESGGRSHVNRHHEYKFSG